MKKIFFSRKLIPALFAMVLLNSISQAANYYSRTNGGSWTDATSWSTTGYGQVTNTGTYPKSTDVAYIGDGYTISINSSFSVGQINIGQGNSGIVEFGEAGNYTLTIINYLTINSGAKFWYNGTSSRTHTLNIGTNLTNSGTFDLYADADDLVNLIFNRSANSIVTGSGTYDLNNVVISKNTSTTYYVDVQSAAFESAIRDFSITYGTFIHNNSGTYDVNSSAGSGFNIVSDAIIKVSQGVLHLSPSQDDVTLQGTLIINGGTVLIGSYAGITGLRYDKSGSFIPKLDIQSGSMEIYGGLTYKSGNSSDPLNFNMSGGILYLNTGSTGTADPIFNINDVATSTYLMTDGNIIFQNPNTTGPSVCDFSICGNNGTNVIGGGTIEFGNSNSTSGIAFNFNPFSNITFPNIKVTGDVSSDIRLVPCSNSTADIKMISLYVDQNKIFDVRSISGTTGDSRSLILTGNMDGINSIYNDGSINTRSSSTLLQGGEGQQIAGANAITFYNLTVDNTYGAALAQTINISGTLTLANGVLFTSTSSPVVLLDGSICDLGSSSSYIDGAFIQTVSSTGIKTLNFPIGKEGAYRPLTLDVTHSSSASVTYQAELFNSSARNFNYNLPIGIDRISGVRYYQIDRIGASNLSTSTITLNYDSDDGVTDYTNLRIVRYDGSSNWEDAGGSGTANGAGIIISSSFNSFGNLFTLGNAFGGTNPLPVKLISFVAKKGEFSVLLKWVTSSEKNADFFDLEKSSDGKIFDKISRITAFGNSITIKNYCYTDFKISNTVVYYRLKQIDKNGDYEYSSIISVSPIKSSEITVFPNPGRSSELNINGRSDWNKTMLIELIDKSGRVIFSDKMVINEGFFNFKPINRDISGNYFVRISEDKESDLLFPVVFVNE